MGIYLDDKEREEAELLREYGTTDPKKIEEIKKDKKATWQVGCFIVFILFFLIPFLIGLVGKCSGGNYDPFKSKGSEWQYKRIEMHY